MRCSLSPLDFILARRVDSPYDLDMNEFRCSLDRLAARVPTRNSVSRVPCRLPTDSALKRAGASQESLDGEDPCDVQFPVTH